MTIPTRKMTFQLTPLLDLLLIVIFAQFMEVQETADQTQAAASESVQDSSQKLNEARTELSVLKNQHTSIVNLLEGDLKQVNDLRGEHKRLLDELAKEKVELTARLIQAVAQREQVGELVAELFRVPEELVDAAVKPRTSAEKIRTPDEIKLLRNRFREFARKDGREIVKHLLTFEELRKRCDIWEIYIAENGGMFFKSDAGTYQFRAESSESFATRIFDRYKSLPQPKSLVIMLLSYGDAKAVYRKAAIDGLSVVAERMRADSNRRSRFEYAVLGYHPHGLTSSSKAIDTPPEK